MKNNHKKNFVSNLFRCFPCLFSASGFTLIELLVVILIIGILAAIALPQYKKAVMLSRTTPVLEVGKLFLHAQQLYRLENGKYITHTNQLNKLSVDIVFPVDWEIRGIAEDGHLALQLKGRTDRAITWDFWPDSMTAKCIIRPGISADSALFNKVCQSATGTSEYTWDNVDGGRKIYEVHL